MPKVPANGINIYYEIHGEGKETLLLIAGYNCDSTIWKPAVDFLQDRYRVILFDNRGIGQSDAPDVPYSIDLMSEDTIQLLDKLNIDACHIAGHSMGGAIAQTIAKRHPERVKKLILLNTLIKASATCALFQKTVIELRKNNLPLPLIVKVVLPWIYSSRFIANSDSVDDMITLSINNPYPPTVTGMSRQCEALLDFDSRSWHHTIAAPTLIIEGEEDILCPHDSKTLAKGIKNAQLITMPKMGHAPIVESPVECAKYIWEFIG